MKFLIKDNPISYDEIYHAIYAYKTEKQNDPSYILIHPETRRNILISSQDENNGLKYRVVEMILNQAKDDYIQARETVFGLYLMRSEDVEPGFMIICG